MLELNEKQCDQYYINGTKTPQRWKELWCLNRNYKEPLHMCSNSSANFLLKGRKFEIRQEQFI